MVFRRAQRAAIFLALAALLPAPPAVANPDLERAREEVESMELDQALESLKSALARGEASPEELREILRLKGEAAAGMGQQEAAQVAFRRLLSLDPDFQLGELASPKITAELDAARVALDGRRLEVSHEVGGGGSAPSVALVITSDPEEMIAGVALLPAGAAEALFVAREPGAARIEIPLPEGAAGGALRAVDEHGNAIAAFEILETEAAPVIGATEDARQDRGLARDWRLWAGGAGFFLATGIAFGLAADRAQGNLRDVLDDSENRFFSEARRYRSRGRRSAVLANVSFTAALLAAGAGAYFFWDARREPRNRGVSVTPSAGPDGAGVLVEVPF